MARTLDRGVVLLHEFSFDSAIEQFRVVQHGDVNCAVSWWGTALAHWGNWAARGTSASLEAGRRALISGGIARKRTPRERAYLDAVAVLYRDDSNAVAARQEYERAMERLSREYPDDVEAAVFRSLALLERPEIDLEAAWDNRRIARASLDRIRQRVNHPGIAHYRMLAADDASLAMQSLDDADAMAAAGRATPYGLHIPSHVYIRRGLWSAVLEANLRSADAARRVGGRADELHALDAQVYAMLQSGMDQQAVAIGHRLPESCTIEFGGTRAVEACYALTAIPARLALERGDWATAAAMPILERSPAWAERMTRLVRALGLARDGRPALARLELAKLGPIDDASTLAALGPIAVDGLNGLERVATAWVLFAEGRTQDAVVALEVAVRREKSRRASDLAFGTLVPAHEALAEMQLELGRNEDALLAFQDALTAAPNRLRSLLGAARAAAAAGHQDEARGYFGRLAEIATTADRPLRPSLDEARQEHERRTSGVPASRAELCRR